MASWRWALALLPALVLARPQSDAPCGYQTCPKPKKNTINIHLVPHTHDDVGWLKTVDQYYYGSMNNIQDAGVQYILDSVVQELLHDPKKRFIYVETAFFWKWWQEQTDSLRHQVKKLVNRGQLEFIGGAWSMHDEATTHYQSIVDQFTWGFRRLSDTFGECGRPRVGWQIDPFGHSRESAAIMARIGFDGLFLGRIDYQDKAIRMKDKKAEMVWSTSHNDQSNATKLFTSVMYNVYSAPKGFCFDINCDDEPIIDNKHSPIYNADKRVTDFLKIMEEYAKSYRTNNVIVTMGEDFMYMDAHVYYKNMDKLIYHINAREDSEKSSKFHAFYSTPSCYLKALNDANVELPVKTDDFMPYGSDAMSYWTGYFTSRPTIKYFERKGNNFLQVCKQLYSLSELGPEDRGDLNAMREAMGVMQHHDAITGTEKQHVARDYARILTDAFRECSIITDTAVNQLMRKEDVPKISAYSCMLHNISSCAFTEDQDSYVVTIYNPLSRPVDRLVRLPIKSPSLTYTILDPKGTEIENQVVPLPPEVMDIPGRNSTAHAELMFVAVALPPLGFRSYYVARNNNIFKTDQETLHNGEPITLGFEKGASVSLDAAGRLAKVSMLGKELRVEDAFYYYNSVVGDNQVPENRSSGAYIFRPDGPEVPINDTFQVKIIDGPVVKEVRTKYADWVSQIARVYKGADYVEFEWLVGPIPESPAGKEVIHRFKTDIHNGDEFSTDSNGREMIRRRLNYRPTWDVQLAEKVPGNYYPVTTAISIAGGDDKKLTVVTDRAQGGSSLREGEVELMVHRRLTHDDAFGVGEALNETAFGRGLVARGSHFVTLGEGARVRLLAQSKVLDAWLFFSPTGGRSFQDWTNNYKMEFSGLAEALPDNVQILTLEPWIGTSFLLRLEHIMEREDDRALSKPATVDLQKLFSLWKIASFEEMMLGANQKVSECKRLVWRTEEGHTPRRPPRQKQSQDITLQPMEIRTFVVEFEKK